MPKLLLATNNTGKAREYRALLRDSAFALTTLDEEGIREEVEETGASFEENARLKAATYAALSGLLTLADDSGLEVDALDGAPGVCSARYAGEGATDEERVTALLTALRSVPDGERSARFRCVIAIATPGGEATTCEGTCEGTILYAPRGEDGFGYDPVFYYSPLEKTFAELTFAEKNHVSHRARAAAQALDMLRSLA